ncbi:MAG: site-2 protease family protein [Candidatus Saccharibacteria bacterium]|nr:site-2 protease family protein [Candidatus Saccharibacteria bacterium]
MNVDVTYIIVVLGVVLVSMTLHEAMHAYAGYWLGDDTARLSGRLSLNPIKHIDPFLTVLLPLLLAISGAPIFGAAKPVPYNPNNIRWDEWGAALLAIAGPLTNLVLAFFIYGLSVYLGQPVNISGVTSGIVGLILTVGVMVNLGFFIFNLIPIPPLDGSRVLYALAPDFVRRGMESMERFGIIVVFALILIGGSAFSTFLLGAMGFFVQLFAKIFGV